ERAESRIREYAPPNPEQIDHLLRNGEASLGASSGATSEVRFVHYFLEGDSMVFTYDTASKRLLRVLVSTDLSSAKDPVILEATFERLPDGVNHLSSATLKASARKVQVNVHNVIYLKLED